MPAETEAEYLVRVAPFFLALQEQLTFLAAIPVVGLAPSSTSSANESNTAAQVVPSNAESTGPTSNAPSGAGAVGDEEAEVPASTEADDVERPRNDYKRRLERTAEKDQKQEKAAKRPRARSPGSSSPVDGASCSCPVQPCPVHGPPDHGHDSPV